MNCSVDIQRNCHRTTIAGNTTITGATVTGATTGATTGAATGSAVTGSATGAGIIIVLRTAVVMMLPWRTGGAIVVMAVAFKHHHVALIVNAQNGATHTGNAVGNFNQIF